MEAQRHAPDERLVRGLNPGHGLAGDDLVHRPRLLQRLLERAAVGEQPGPHHGAGLRHRRHPLGPEQGGRAGDAKADGRHREAIAWKLDCGPKGTAGDDQFADTQRPPAINNARRLASVPSARHGAVLEPIIEISHALPEVQQVGRLDVIVRMGCRQVRKLLKRGLLGRPQRRTSNQLLVHVLLVRLRHLQSDLCAETQDAEALVEHERAVDSREVRQHATELEHFLL